MLMLKVLIYVHKIIGADTAVWPGALPTNAISIEFEIWPKFAVLWFKMCSTDHNKILHTSRQYNCRDVC